MVVEPKSKMVCDKVFARNAKIKRIPINHGELAKGKEFITQYNIPVFKFFTHTHK
jgi:hypothetical protein